MNIPQEKVQVEHARVECNAIINVAKTILLGKEEVLRLSLTCLIARGHLLIEDMPGVGKTILAHVLANTLGLGFKRIQFTSDMLPADILGVSIFNRDTGSFNFHPGPIFNEVILADEVNRATPRAQSALLEAMEENQVTVEGETRTLPVPFFVIATQNPSHQVGTFPLPESQLDRFTMKIVLGYPNPHAEKELLKGRDRRELLKEITPVIDPTKLTRLQSEADNVHVAEPLLDYLQDLLEYSRLSGDFITGLSPRAGLAILHCARAWSLMQGRSHVIPEDIQKVLPSVICHRLHLAESGKETGPMDAAEKLISKVPIP